MSTTYIDRFTGSVVADLGKQPCDASTIGPITLSGYQTVDGVNLNADNMRCLVRNQTDQTTNGIYVVTSAAWYRAGDFSGPSGTVNGQLIYVTGGTSLGLWQLTTPNPVQIDNAGGQTTPPSNITFTMVPALSISVAMTPVVTAATLALGRTAFGLGSSATENLTAIIKDNGAGGLTIGTAQVTNAMLANMAQALIKGRASGAGTGAPVDLTAAQATAILNAFVGDSGSGGTKGQVPAPAAGDAAASKYLFADGTWKTVQNTQSELAGNLTVTSNTTLADVTGGIFAYAASSTYRFSIWGRVDSGSAGGFKLGLAASAALTAMLAVGYTDNAGAFVGLGQGITSPGSLVAGAFNAGAHFLYEGYFTTNGAGNLSLQFAQNSSSATPSVLSYAAMRITKTA